MKTARRAFTLIELLTVIAITAVLLTIIVVPVVQTFNLTRSAQAFQEAQDRARIVTERISREMSNSASLRDNSGIGGTVDIVVPSGPGSAQPLVTVPLTYAKVDMFPPAQEGLQDTSGGYIDPNTGKVDPTLKAPKGQIALSAGRGITMVRYFVGLRNPFAPYNNPYQVWDPTDTTSGAVLKARGNGRDNLYVLYRVEVPVYKLDQIVGSPTRGQLIVNNDYFFDMNRDGSNSSFGPLFDDPDFFNPNIPFPAYSATRTDDKTKAQVVQDWLDRATVVTELSRYDMIQPFFDKSSRKVVFDPITDAGGNEFAPRLLSLVSFRPSRVSEGAAEGKLAVRMGEETDNSATIAPDVYTTKGIGWVNAKVTMYPVFTGRLSPAWVQGTDPLTIGRIPFKGQANAPLGFSIYGHPGTSPEDVPNLETELFDADAYMSAVSNPSLSPYPFSYGLLQANSRSGWLTSAALRAEYLPVFAPYMPDGNLGRILASFGINEVGNPASANPPPAGAANLPTALNGPDVTPSNDLPASPPTNPGTGTPMAPINTGVFSDPDFQSINRRFNKVWFDYSDLRPQIHRFLDLRVTPQIDGTASPLDPTNGFSRARLVPGSEEVVGPDQRPGPNYGILIRYTRTTNQTVGANQYRINYVDQQEPDYSLVGLPTLAGFNQNVYDPTNFVSAVYQPRFKAGYIEFNSDPNVPLPALMPNPTGGTPALVPATVSVYYKFQFTQAVRRQGQPSGVGAGDTFAVEYDSRQLMSVQVTIRNYPQTTLPNVQTVTLKSEAPIRNYLR